MVTTELTATIFNIQKFSVHDGPGIRTTVFMKGCPLRCRWCSNAESMNPQPELGIIRSICNLCGDCMEVCPKHAITIENKDIQIDRQKCDACGECVKVCSQEALTVYGRFVNVDDVMKEVRKDKAFYSGSEGGVTVSGGEPLRQWEFVREILKQCKNENIGTCLDTCGSVPDENLRHVLPYADNILYDLKVFDSEAHKEFTGVSNEQIKKNAETDVESDANILFRIPLIEGVNSSLDNIRETAGFIASLGAGQSVELLPYHILGVGKYTTLDREYPGTDFKTPSEKNIQIIKDIFHQYGVNCAVGG